MDPVTAGLVVGGIGAGLGAWGQSRANKSAERMAREARDWEAHMSNTAMWRGVRDLKNAGLNPMLAYTQGGASTPNAEIAPVNNVMEGASASAMDIVRAREEIANMRATKENIQKDTELKEAQTRATEGTAKKTDSEGTMMQILKNWFTKGNKAVEGAVNSAKTDKHPPVKMNKGAGQ